MSREQDDKKRRKNGRRKIAPRGLRPSSRITEKPRGSQWPRSRPTVPRRDSSHFNESRFRPPRPERPHWSGKAEIWTEPQRPRQNKTVRYEVDTDKLLRELDKGNRETLEEIAERLERQAKAEQDSENKETETHQETDHPETITKEETKEEPSKQIEPSETEEETTEPNTEAKEESDTQEQPENADHENQEISQDVESPPETNPQEDMLDAPELVYMNPAFWEQLESDLEADLEQFEPEEDFEIPPEENEPINEEGY